MTLIVHPQRAAGFLERGLQPDAAHDVEQPAIGARVAYVVGRDHGNFHRGGECCKSAVEALFTGVEMTLQIDIKIRRAENRAQSIRQSARIFAANQHPRKRTHHPAGKTDKPAAVALELVESDAAFALGWIDGSRGGAFACARTRIQDAHLRVGDHPAEIFVARTIGNQDIEPRVVVERQLRADDLPDTR